MTEASKKYFKILEENIENIPFECREKIYYPCAVNCVKEGVLQEEKKRFDECDGDMDFIYEKYAKTDYYFRNVIEKGHIYELGYPRCLCYLVDEGICKTSGHCECSRQSIIYILHELMPSKNIKVKLLKLFLEEQNDVDLGLRLNRYYFLCTENYRMAGLKTLVCHFRCK